LSSQRAPTGRGIDPAHIGTYGPLWIGARSYVCRVLDRGVAQSRLARVGKDSP